MSASFMGIRIVSLPYERNLGFNASSILGIQDMIVLQENGLLLSCAYDKKVIVWKY
jgi:hypothetical protein